MAHGIKRLFTALACIWFVVAGTVWLSSPKTEYSAQELATIGIEVVILYALGWILPFIWAGFTSRPHSY